LDLFKELPLLDFLPARQLSNGLSGQKSTGLDVPGFNILDPHFGPDLTDRGSHMAYS
jgi:hypothetical protein